MSRQTQISSMIMVGMSAAMLAIIAQLSIPTPWGIPISLQPIGVAVIGCILGWKKGAAAMVVYLLLGAAGVPVFTSFRSGLPHILGLTGGFILSYPFMAALCGIGMKQKKRLGAVGFLTAGILLCHLMGTVQFAVVGSYTLMNAFMLASFPYLVKDLVTTYLSYMFARTISVRLERAQVKI